MIWKVKVKCEGHGKTAGGRVRSYNHWVTCLVEAETDDAAFASAQEFAQSVAPFGPKWESFDPREASRFELPASI